MKQIQKYIAIAKSASNLSKDTTKIGALALDARDRIVGVGVNGYPPGYDDSDLEGKYDKVIHAEINALLNSQARPGEIKTIVIYGLPPCSECVKHLIAHGVTQIYYNVNNEINSLQMWEASNSLALRFHRKFISIKEIRDD